MPEPPATTRRLHGVLLADVTGFSRLMGDDERRALAAVQRVHDVFAHVVPEHGGTLEVAVGDCFVALFGSATDALRAALDVQATLGRGHEGGATRIRIGLHLGDVVRRGTEVFGDSVNVAARLQTLAEPGGIVVSGDVYRAVRGKVTVEFRDLGRKRLKNIAEPVRVYAVADPAAAPSRGPGLALRVGAGVVAVGALGVSAVLLARYVSSGAERRPAAPLPAATAAAPTAEHPRIVGVTGIGANGDVPPWMREVARDGLNTILSKVPGLRVYSRQKIDFLRERRGLSEIEAAETLGIEKMIAGSLTLDGSALTLEVQVVDTASGLLDASERVTGKPSELIELQNQLADELLQTMRIALSPEQRRLIFAKRTNETLESYKLLSDTLADAPSPSQAPPTIPDTGDTSWWFGPAAALAAEGGDAETAVHAVIEAYRAALQAKDVAAVAALHLELNDAQRAALEKYFETADGLVVTVADVDILVEGDQALATFTRHDAFTDKRSGKPVELEVRLSSVVVRVDGGWKMRGVKKS